MVLDIAGPVGSKIHHHGGGEGVDIVDPRSLVDPVEKVAGGGIVEKLILVLSPVVMTGIESQPVPRAEVHIETAQLIVVAVAIHRVDGAVLETARKAGRIGLGEVLEIL